MWRNLKLYPCRVLSIRLFLKDLPYVKALVGCVEKLVQPGRRQTVFEALRQYFVIRNAGSQIRLRLWWDNLLVRGIEVPNSLKAAVG